MLWRRIEVQRKGICMSSKNLRCRCKWQSSHENLWIFFFNTFLHLLTFPHYLSLLSLYPSSPLNSLGTPLELESRQLWKMFSNGSCADFWIQGDSTRGKVSNPILGLSSKYCYMAEVRNSGKRVNRCKSNLYTLSFPSPHTLASCAVIWIGPFLPVQPPSKWESGSIKTNRNKREKSLN